MSVRIIEGDALTRLRDMPDKSVQMCCTSPPYFGLRDYGVVGQLGLERTPDLYVEAMVGVFREVRRVLRDDATLWLNIGDSYTGAANNGGVKGSLVGTQNATGRSLPIKGGEGIKPKDLIGIPWLLAFALRADGWYLRSDIIWHKPNPMPESVTDRPTKSHEYLFLFAKSERYFYDADAIREDTIAPATSSQQRKPAGWDTGAGGHGSFHRKGRAEETEYTDIERGGRNRRSVWSIATQPYSEVHFATFPPKLIEPCILAGSAKQACEKCGAPWERVTERISVRDVAVGLDNPLPKKRARQAMGLASSKSGLSASNSHNASTPQSPVVTTLGWEPTCDCENSGTGKSLVLDPFGGAGTTGLVADRLGRDALLIELNPKYAEMARRRIHSDNPLFGDVA